MFIHRLLVVVLPLLVSVVASTAVRGEQSVREFNVAGSLIQVHFSDSFTQPEQKKVVHWLQRHAGAVTTLYGEFPIPVAKVRVEKAVGSSEPVPWGRVIREREEGVLVRVNPEFSHAEFVRDWTATHEFSHLFIPFPGNRDSWFSEGLATYLQNTLRVRAAMLTEQQGWQKLYEGLRRGQRDTAMRGMPLAELSPKMHDSNSYQRVYWSGVWYFLKTEIDLFAASSGRQSLDTVLQEFNRCCRFKKQFWSAALIAEKFDEISATNVFSKNLHAIRNTHALPAIEPLLSALGLRVSNSGQVAIAAKFNVLQQRIMNGAQTEVAP